MPQATFGFYVGEPEEPANPVCRNEMHGKRRFHDYLKRQGVILCIELSATFGPEGATQPIEFHSGGDIRGQEIGSSHIREGAKSHDVERFCGCPCLFNDKAGGF